MIFGMESHPSIVHFPIALSVVGALAAVAYVAIRKEWLRWLAPILLSIALLGAIAGYFSGESAEDRAEAMGIPEDVIAKHEEQGMWSLWLIGLACLLSWATHSTGRAVWVSALAALAAAGVVLSAGHLGGELVYIHGAGRVSAPSHAPPHGGSGSGGEKAGGEKAGGEHAGGEKPDDD